MTKELYDRAYELSSLIKDKEVKYKDTNSLAIACIELLHSLVELEIDESELLIAINYHIDKRI